MSMDRNRSPILFLEHSIAGVPFTIAPEKSSDLSDLNRKHNFTLSFIDRKGLSFAIVVSKNEISVPIAALEFLWALSYALLIFYEEYCVSQRSGSGEMLLGGTPRSSHAMQLFNWAIQNMRSDGTQSWPPELATPSSNPISIADSKKANELFLAALGWILHHEIGHARLSHADVQTATTISIQEEQDADNAATAWMFAQATDASQRSKRMLGVITAVMALQIEEPRQVKKTRVRTHPRSVDRLHHCFELYAASKDDDEVFAFAAVSIQIYLEQLNVRCVPDGTSFKEIFEELLVALARLPSE
jgi:hypothetical protein